MSLIACITINYRPACCVRKLFEGKILKKALWKLELWPPVFDRGGQIGKAVKTASTDTFLGDHSKPPLYQVQPRGTGGNKVKVNLGCWVWI